MNKETNAFGCIACWPSSAESAWEALKSMKIDVELVDESHFMIKIRSCTKCAQQYLSVFTETIDWVAGEDPQHWTVIPLTPEEAQDFISADSNVEAKLIALPSARKSLCHDYPKGSDPASYWSKGVAIGPHD